MHPVAANQAQRGTVIPPTPSSGRRWPSGSLYLPSPPTVTRPGASRHSPNPDGMAELGI
jgi:hypothetical protein